MTKQEEIINTIKVLRTEVEVLTSRLNPHATGHLHTAIGVLNSRIEELIEEVTAPYFKNEDRNIDYSAVDTKASHLMSIEGAL
jgi:archaellum component FlaC